MTSENNAADYRDTILLPQDTFPRRAGLAQKEPQYLEKWQQQGLYQKAREQRQGNEKFVLHAGPPFANGHIHMGTAFTFILKDMVVRTQAMLGKDTPLVPGFDCHGLPIEWKIEEKYRKKKKKKEDIPVAAFRQECEDFALDWVKTQSSEFARLGVWADWDNPYLTLHKESEARIAGELHKFLQAGLLYRGSKPVMWSVPEQTALAEAEVEYKDYESDAIYVRFPVRSFSGKSQDAIHSIGQADVLIWTTTPWTIPGNRAIGYGKDIEYICFSLEEIPHLLPFSDDDTATSEHSHKGVKVIIATDLLNEFVKLFVEGLGEENLVKKIKENPIWQGTGADLAGMTCHHPLASRGYDFDVPLLPGDFVTTEQGTGFVHLAPGHGEDDYNLCMAHNIKVPETVGGDGKYVDELPLFGSDDIYEGATYVYFNNGKKGQANKRVIDELNNVKGILGEVKSYKHTYPHSWRSGAPVIYRATPQWFIAMDKQVATGKSLREQALHAIENVNWVPSRGEARITSMVSGRGDWCISRQRAWGVPVAIFADKKTGQPLSDPAVLQRTQDLFREHGAGCWYEHPASDFLGDDHNPEDYDQITDIIDVWFESGCTQSYVLEGRDELHWPADMYLEGSDQHRGWFQSSLLIGAATRADNNGAPYKTVLTNGFVLDEKGYKMSKSVGNVISPMDVAKQSGADIVRLWVASSDYQNDVRVGQSILKGVTDLYRRIRGTFWFIIGNLSSATTLPEIDEAQLAPLDRWLLHRLTEIDTVVRDCINTYDFVRLNTTLHNFCTNELSSIYFDVNKDNLYCNAADSPERQATQAVLNQVHTCLCHWFAPILCFTAEEAWEALPGKGSDSIHLSTLPDLPENWQQPELGQQFSQILTVRRVITGALEEQRRAKEIGASLEAAPVVHITDAALLEACQNIDMATLSITSGITLTDGSAPADAYTLDDVPGVTVVFKRAEQEKCERCWRYLKTASHPDLCPRCENVVAIKKAA